MGMNNPVKIELPPLTLSPFERNFWQKIYKDKWEEADGKWLRDIYIFLESWVSEEEDMELKTSGSTGNPKRINVAKETLVFSARQTQEYFRFKEGEKWLLCLPAAFIGGQMILVRAMVSQTMVWAMEPKIDLSGVVDNFDFASMTPMQATDYINSADRNIKRILIGGAAIPFSLEQKLKKETRTEFYASYGMTETVSHIALRKINGTGASLNFEAFKNVLTGIDERGCLTIYHRQFSKDVLITNDLVEFGAGNGFRVKGRIDNVINSGGLKISPEEIEQKLSSVLEQPIMISGIPDELTGEKLILFMEGDPLPELVMELLKKYIKDHLEKNKIPREIIFLPRFSRTDNGKIDRRKTREDYLNTLRSNL